MTWRWVGRRSTAARADEAWTAASRPRARPRRWLGEFYPDLRRRRRQAVSLYEADRLVYGPMSLEVDG